MTVAPLPAEDVGRIIDDGLAGLGLSLSASGRDAIVSDLTQALRFDHDARRFLILDDAGHPKVELDSAGAVQTVDLAGHLRTLAKGNPASSKSAAGSTDNPFKAGSGWNRTRQAVLRNKNPELAKRLESEAR